MDPVARVDVPTNESRPVQLPADLTQPPVNGPHSPQTVGSYAESIRDLNRSLGLGRNVDVVV